MVISAQCSWNIKKKLFGSSFGYRNEITGTGGGAGAIILEHATAKETEC